MERGRSSTGKAAKWTAGLAAGAIALALHPAAASTAQRSYLLSGGGLVTQGCYPPCLCMLYTLGEPQGSFTLAPVSADEVAEVYVVDGLRIAIPGKSFSITASGTYYRYIGATDLGQHMILDALLDGEPCVFDSGFVPADAPFPILDVEVSINHKVCYDTVIRIVAAPMAAPGDLDLDGCVGQADLGILLSCYGMPCGDVDADGATDQTDLGLLLGSFGEGCDGASK